MDEIKNNQPQNGENRQGGQNGQGGRRKRHRHHKNNAQNNQNNQNNQNGQNVQNKQPQNNQNGQGGQRKNNKHHKPNKQGGQVAQNNQATQNNQGAQNVQNKQPQQQKQQKQKQQKQNQKISGGNPNKKDTYLYALDGNLYVNLTNKCSNGCDFCVRNECESYYGYYLWLKNGEVTTDKVIAAAKTMDLSQFKEVVFCGFGEPTYKMKEMLELCDYFHEKGMRTRLNTNCQGNLINKRDIVPELKGKIDFVNISLNFSCAEKYQPVCRSQFGANGYEAILEFARQCKKNEVDCRFSIVDCIGEEEVEACKRLAECLRVPLYVRSYITDSGE